LAQALAQLQALEPALVKGESARPSAIQAQQLGLQRAAELARAA
jgi:hypothetical protein